MSEIGASYAFLPWTRRGLSAAAGQGAVVGERLRTLVEVSFGSGRVATIPLDLAGAGDVAGLDSRVVARTWPRANAGGVEPNYFPMVEFSQVDLPWRYTPAATPAGDRLQPWICLIVLTDEEIASIMPASPARPLPALEAADAPLPLLGQAWAWAHAQLTGAETASVAELRLLLAGEPHRLTSRLLCPRRLEPGVSYNAFIVPTFDSGRRAGLGLPAGDPQAPAWADGARAALLPVYYQWRFGTGARGDFEDLARRLKPARLPPSVGGRAMDVGAPGAGLPAAASASLAVEGALRAPEFVSTPWPGNERQAFVAPLAELLSRPAALLELGVGEPVVAPPLYGARHAAKNRLDPQQETSWFEEANSDPRHRVAAGLGAEVIRANQHQLMASAWAQSPRLPEMNRTLRAAQLAREVALRIHQRIASADDERVLQLTGAVHGRLRASPTTVRAVLEASPVAAGLLSGAWRRATRTLGPIGRRQARVRGERSSVVARVNAGALAPGAPPPTPATLATPSRVGRSLAPDGATAASLGQRRTLARRAAWLGVALVAAGLLAFAAGGVVLALLAVGAGVAAVLGAYRLRADANRLAPLVAVRDGALGRDQIDALPPRPDFVAVDPGAAIGGAPPPPAPVARVVAGAGGDSRSGAAFRAAAGAMLAQVGAGVDDEIEAIPRQASLAALRATLERSLDPTRTIAAPLRDRLQLAEGVYWRPDDALEPVVVGPRFPQPMYAPLAALSGDWLLPGLKDVPGNSVSLALSNQRFIEAFMLGLNHEMGCELLWREYPTEPRRTFFRQFWDPSGFVAPGGAVTDPDRLADIRAIHTWPPEAALGTNSPRAGATADQLVVVIRGDVIGRYPNLLVYAVRAVWTAQGGRDLGSDELQPVFSGALEPDIAFFGFSFTKETALGSAEMGTGDPGWYFVLQEAPSEPRFGLDEGAAGGPPPATWNALSWGHLVAPADGPGAVQYIDLAAPLPDTSHIAQPMGVHWHEPEGTTAAQLAFATLQRPMRIAIHASEMLPQ